VKEVIKIAFAYIGIIVGAGLASGQEVLQYYTSFGLMGTIGAIVGTVLYMYTGWSLVWIGSRLKTISHKEAIYQMSGRVLGTVIDYILIFTLFGVGVVMLAGAGSNLEQQFGLPNVTGVIIMSLLIISIGMLNLDKVVGVIGSVTPFLLLFVIIISIYSFITMDSSFAALDSFAREQPSSLPNWLIAGINHASFNTAVGASMALVMGGASKSPKAAALGGLLGGLGIGLMILISHLAIFSKIEDVAHTDLPLLAIVNEISPFLGIIMAIVLYGMIFNTAMSMFYSFASRFVKRGTTKFNIFLIVTMIIAFILSFAGFTELVAWFYPLIGYLGLVLIIVLIITPFRIKKNGTS
jgi:uncharacterized membrane protein YkvI